MNQVTPITASADVQLWHQGSGPVPGWLMPWMVGRVEPNGTFLIETPLGQQRVHPNYVVIEQFGEVYASPPSEVAERVAELRERTALASRPLNMVGPGKSLKTAIPASRRSRHQKIERVRSYPPVRGTPPSIEWVSVTDLRVDGDYQRSIENQTSSRLIAAIAVNRRPKRTPYRRSKGTPFVERCDGYGGRAVRAGCGVGRA